MRGEDKLIVKDIKDLAQAEGGYQDIVINGETVYKGWRECQDRWDIIKNYIHKNSVVLDIGSHYGYYSEKIAEKYKDNLVWSFEPSKDRAKIQKLMLQANKTKNVILTQEKVTLMLLLELSRLTEGIDTILMLSVIHYFKPNEVPTIIWLCSRIAPRLIIEVPNDDESEVAELTNVRKLENIETFLNRYYKDINLIGKSSAPKQGTRKIFKAENPILVKDGVVGYIGGELARTHRLVFKNSEWKLDNNKKYTIGLNLYNILHYYTIYPNLEKFKQRTAERYYDVLKTEHIPTDISYRNAILTPFDVDIIDSKEKLGKEIYGLEWNEYKSRIEKYSIKDFDNELRSRK